MHRLRFCSYIDGSWIDPPGPAFHNHDPRTGEALHSYRGCGPTEIEEALAAADRAAERLRQASRATLAAFLRRIAEELEVLGEPFLEIVDRETGLGLPRLWGELGRTCGQLRAFADLVDEGQWVEPTLETADPERQPVPKPDLRRMLRPLGPVVVFGASNFPLAFGALGGDTASALAAGNPVVVKGHPSHPATNELCARAVDKARLALRLPAGVFALLQGNREALGVGLVEHPKTRAVGFTGSLRGGRALMDRAAVRPEPIPVYAEMGSLNPVFVTPGALAERAEELAHGLCASACLGTGQFCTAPGVVVSLADPRFRLALVAAFEDASVGVLLNPGVAAGLSAGLTAWDAKEGVEMLVGGMEPPGQGFLARPCLAETDAATFLADSTLGEEVFGPAMLLVTCHDSAEMTAVAQRLAGSLTATLHAVDDELGGGEVRALAALLESKVGRLIWNGFPTGVEVCPSMHHGGPYPAAYPPGATSVGADAIRRFATPVAYQDVPDCLLPEALRNGNPWCLMRRVDGRWTRETSDCQEAVA